MAEYMESLQHLAEKFGKPFFFAESGCMSVKGSNLVPNDWSVKGDVDLQGQADWYKAMFAACEKRDWVKGFGVWDWAGRQYSVQDAVTHGGYDIYAKPAEQGVAEVYGRKGN